MTITSAGLHHVTAICGEPNRNAEFYVEVLGLRLVKYTVNHDDPTTPHLYYGDRRGNPGTNLTFFVWPPDRKTGDVGAGQTTDSAYLIRPGSLTFWMARLDARGIDFDEETRFDEPVLRFRDPDGIGIELVASPVAADADVEPWEKSCVPVQHQLCGFHGVTLAVGEPEATEELLSGVLDYERVAESEGRIRLQAAPATPGSAVDLLSYDGPRGVIGIGSVHHVAFKVSDVEEQQRLRDELVEVGLEPTERYDRLYFQSIYCREPGGVLFEFATMEPGFTRDETIDKLGETLVLPKRLEEERREIEAALPDFSAPAASR